MTETSKAETLAGLIENATIKDARDFGAHVGIELTDIKTADLTFNAIGYVMAGLLWLAYRQDRQDVSFDEIVETKSHKQVLAELAEKFGLDVEALAAAGAKKADPTSPVSTTGTPGENGQRTPPVNEDGGSS